MGTVAYGNANPDPRSSIYSTGSGYQNYRPQSLLPMRPYSLIAAPHAYINVGIGAGAAAAAAVGGAAAMTYSNNNNSNPALPNPFAVNAVDAAEPVPVPINVPDAPPPAPPPAPPAPPAAGQPTLVVTRTFTPNLDDELSVATGESVRVLAIYDDGWCKVRKLGVSDEEGVVPYECLGDPTAGAQGGLGIAQNDQSRRSSSLYDAPRA